MINQKLQDFDEEVKPVGDTVTQATIEMYNAIIARFLPTPTKIHYLFNLRDISRVRSSWAETVRDCSFLSTIAFFVHLFIYLNQLPNHIWFYLHFSTRSSRYIRNFISSSSLYLPSPASFPPLLPTTPHCLSQLSFSCIQIRIVFIMVCPLKVYRCSLWIQPSPPISFFLLNLPSQILRILCFHLFIYHF